MLAHILAASILVCTTLTAQSCPDRVVEHVPGRISIGTVMQCNDPSAVWRPAGGKVNLFGCPSIVVVYPGHDTPRSQPGSGTWVEFVQRFEVMQYIFSCETDYFLFIPLTTNCRLVDKRSIAARNDYVERVCPATQVDAIAVEGS